MKRAALSDVRRVVIKFGTAVVTRNGTALALGRLNSLVEEIAGLRERGLDVLLVSSGAVGMGVRQLRLAERPRSLGLRQACAAVGQSKLMGLYTTAFEQLGTNAAQVLLTQDDLADRDRALCLRTTLMRLLELGTVPILNENDSVSVRELMEHGAPRDDGGRGAFGDNDGLSARVAVAVDADALLLLSDVDGLYTGNPRHDANAERIREVAVVDEALLSKAEGESPGGTGGMRSKLEAARLAGAAGVTTVIAAGDTPSVLTRILAGDDLGTQLYPGQRRAPRKRSIAVSEQHGRLVVNEGALAALFDQKASLLPVGVLGAEGNFKRGDVVEICDESGRVHARGIVNYDAESCRALAGRHSSEIGTTLGLRGYDSLINRDNLVLGDV